MTQKYIVTGAAAVAGIAVVALFFLGMSPFTGSHLPANVAGSGGLIVQDIMPGSGAEALAGSRVTVHYTGQLEDGTVFDTSRERTPFTFTLGAGSVIEGWDQGLAGMRVGGKRLLVIPPGLGYGVSGYGPIPGNATLIFEVELLAVEGAAQ